MSRSRTAVVRQHFKREPSSPHYRFSIPRCRNYASASTGSSSTSGSSADPNEIAHFNALAPAWWDPHGSSRLLHLMNPLRHEFISSCLSSSSSSASSPHGSGGGGGGEGEEGGGRRLRYLDVGCGGGIFAESAARLPTTEKVVGIDASPDVLHVARLHARQDPALQRDGKLSYLHTSVEQLRAHEEHHRHQYDVLTLFEVLEHIPHPAPFLGSCLPLVKPGGWLIVSTIARTWTSWLTTKLVAEYLVGIVPRGTHDWRRYLNHDELRRWFAAQPGWDVSSCRVRGLAYLPALGWRELPSGEKWGNYFFGVRKDA